MVLHITHFGVFRYLQDSPAYISYSVSSRPRRSGGNWKAGGGN